MVDVLVPERRDLLLERLRRDGRVIAKDIAAELGLSEDSVRRDLREMAAANLCQRADRAGEHRHPGRRHDRARRRSRAAA
ncbi:DeoR family transcriptional regulator [Modestobacter excelsi]|uniref:DeoR family transcriptional regulator n=1 Tax=Modestobacter excelsi TaxID=2213161 RepID=UPI001FECF262|nr:DeoR family transcriptional regulator [Modestobacter excelsi]